MWNKYVVITVGGWVDPLLPSTLPPALYPPPDGHQTGNETEYGDQQDNQLLLRGENRNSEKNENNDFIGLIYQIHQGVSIDCDGIIK